MHFCLLFDLLCFAFIVHCVCFFPGKKQKKTQKTCKWTGQVPFFSFFFAFCRSVVPFVSLFFPFIFLLCFFGLCWFAFCFFFFYVSFFSSLLILRISHGLVNITRAMTKTWRGYRFIERSYSYIYIILYYIIIYILYYIIIYIRICLFLQELSRSSMNDGWMSLQHPSTNDLDLLQTRSGRDLMAWEPNEEQDMTLDVFRRCAIKCSPPKENVAINRKCLPLHIWLVLICVNVLLILRPLWKTRRMGPHGKMQSPSQGKGPRRIKGCVQS